MQKRKTSYKEKAQKGKEAIKKSANEKRSNKENK